MSSIDYTIHRIYLLKQNQYYIVSSLRTRNDTTIIYIDSCTGDLIHKGIQNIDVFPREEDAIDFLKSQDPQAKEVSAAAAIVGYVVTPKVAYLFLATQIAGTMILPPFHPVYTITESNWLPIPLSPIFAFPEYSTVKQQDENEEIPCPPFSKNMRLPKVRITNVPFSSDAVSEIQSIDRSFPIHNLTNPTNSQHFMWTDYTARSILESNDVSPRNSSSFSEIHPSSTPDRSPTASPSLNDFMNEPLDNSLTLTRPVAPEPPSSIDGPIGPPNPPPSTPQHPIAAPPPKQSKGFLSNLVDSLKVTFKSEPAKTDQFTPSQKPQETQQQQRPKLPLNYIYQDCQSLETAMRFDVDRYHYFCEEADITRPFTAIGLSSPKPPTQTEAEPPHPLSASEAKQALPFTIHPVEEYDPAFLWNSFLRQKFEEAGLPHHCVVLCQGAATTYPLSLFVPGSAGVNLPDTQFSELSQLMRIANALPEKPTIFLSIISRKSSLNPGTRYQARGLNEFGGAGNEMECEVIAWLVDKPLVRDTSKTPPESESSDFNVYFTSYIFFRGTIPILWKAGVDSFFTQAKVDVEKNASFEHVPLYWERARLRYSHFASCALPPKPDDFIKFTCLTLLRLDEKHPEEIKLTEGYQASTRQMKTFWDSSDQQTKTPFSTAAPEIRYNSKGVGAQIDIKTYDWHAIKSSRGENGVFTPFWSRFQTYILQHGYASGRILVQENKPADRQNMSFFEEIQESYRNGVELWTLQNGLFRLNCADSMDRTSVASFSFMLPIFNSQLTTLLTAFNSPKHEPVTQHKYELFDNLRDTPDVTTEDIKKALPMGVLSPLSEAFVILANTNSELYTDSPATHTQLIRSFLSPIITSNNLFSHSFSSGLDASSLVHIPRRDLDLSLFTLLSSGRFPFKSMMTFIRPSTDREFMIGDKIQSGTGNMFKQASSNNALISIKRRYHNMVTDESKHKEFSHFVALQLLPEKYPGTFWQRNLSDLMHSPLEATPTSVISVPFPNVLPSPPLTSYPKQVSHGAVFSLEKHFAGSDDAFGTLLPIHLSGLLQSNQITTHLPLQERSCVKLHPVTSLPLSLTSVLRKSLAEKLMTLGIVSIIDTTNRWRSVYDKPPLPSLSPVMFNFHPVDSPDYTPKWDGKTTTPDQSTDETVTIILPEPSVVRYLIMDRPTAQQETTFRPVSTAIEIQKSRDDSRKVTHTGQSVSVAPTVQWAGEGGAIRLSRLETMVGSSEYPSSMLLHTSTSADVYMGESLDSLVLTHKNVALPLIPNNGFISLDGNPHDGQDDTLSLTNLPGTFYELKGVKYLYQSVVVPVSPYPITTNLSNQSDKASPQLDLPFAPVPPSASSSTIGLISVIKVVFHAPLSYSLLDHPASFVQKPELVSSQVKSGISIHRLHRAMIVGRVRVLGHRLNETRIPSARQRMDEMLTLGAYSDDEADRVEERLHLEEQIDNRPDVIEKKSEIMEHKTKVGAGMVNSSLIETTTKPDETASALLNALRTEISYIALNMNSEGQYLIWKLFSILKNRVSQASLISQLKQVPFVFARLSTDHPPPSSPPLPPPSNPKYSTTVECVECHTKPTDYQNCRFCSAVFCETCSNKRTITSQFLCEFFSTHERDLCRHCCQVIAQMTRLVRAFWNSYHDNITVRFRRKLVNPFSLWRYSQRHLQAHSISTIEHKTKLRHVSQYPTSSILFSSSQLTYTSPNPEPHLSSTLSSLLIGCDSGGWMCSNEDRLDLIIKLSEPAFLSHVKLRGRVEKIGSSLSLSSISLKITPLYTIPTPSQLDSLKHSPLSTQRTQESVIKSVSTTDITFEIPPTFSTLVHLSFASKSLDSFLFSHLILLGSVETASIPSDMLTASPNPTLENLDPLSGDELTKLLDGTYPLLSSSDRDSKESGLHQLLYSSLTHPVYSLLKTKTIIYPTSLSPVPRLQKRLFLDGVRAVAGIILKLNVPVVPFFVVPILHLTFYVSPPSTTPDLLSTFSTSTRVVPLALPRAPFEKYIFIPFDPRDTIRCTIVDVGILYGDAFANQSDNCTSSNILKEATLVTWWRS
ncbi:putative Polyphosphoinositide phosphatase [Blattamonas nauphoetae]|uniref:Polyphosphoinositide phosphatase n=1 Tax=Blattamonas nauphoetae TaxID=2049346 RepID=A0ABQ9XT72_9EUKA|nr:putative Polyphosphoinositide phosphatase [Blattamonas nauphoetae]